MCSKRRLLHGHGFQPRHEGRAELVRRVPGERALGLQAVAAAEQGAREAVRGRDRVADRARLGRMEDAGDAPAFKPLFQSFLDGLGNRNADDDRSRGKRHLAPKFDRMQLADVDFGAVMEWIDEQRAAGELSDASIRHNMNLLSRFFSWAIARGHASINPVRMIPMGSRPTQTVKSDTPWLEDAAVARKLIAELEE